MIRTDGSGSNAAKPAQTAELTGLSQDAASLQRGECFGTHGIDAPCEGVSITGNFLKMPKGLRNVLSPVEERVYQLLIEGSWQRGKNYIYTSRRLIAEKCRISVSSVQNAISTLKKINLVIEQEGRDNLRTLFIVGLPKKCAFSVDSRVHETTRSRTPGERSRTPDERERSPDDTALYSSLDSSLDESLEHTSISSEPSFDQDRRNEYKDRTAESTGCDDGFERFWRVYPNQIGKLAARKAWDALNPSENLVSKIIEAVKRQQCWDRWREQDGRFIPAPASWLEQQRWNDVGSPMDERKWKSIRDWGHESRKEQ